MGLYGSQWENFKNNKNLILLYKFDRNKERACKPDSVSKNRL